jgi:hypothetical protein
MEPGVGPNKHGDTSNSLKAKDIAEAGFIYGLP